MNVGPLPEPMTVHQALRVLERQITKCRESVGFLDAKRPMNDPLVNQAIDVLWEYVIKGGNTK